MRVTVACLAAILVAAVLVAIASASSKQGPTLEIVSEAVVMTRIKDGSAGRAKASVRFCAELGPRAVLFIRETRRWRGAQRAVRSTVEPLGVDLDHVMPYRCVARFSIGWLVPTSLLVGGGTYSVSVRLRDGRLRLSRSVGFSVRT